MDFFVTTPLQGATAVDNASVLGSPPDQCLLVSCHDAIHAYTVDNTDGGGGAGGSSMQRAWSCTMLDHMEGLVRLPPVPPPTLPTTDSRGGWPGAHTFLALASSGTVELYGVRAPWQPASSTGEPPAPPHMKLLASSPLVPPAVPPPFPPSAAGTSSCRVDGSISTVLPMVRRPEGPTWSTALTVTDRSGGGGGGSRGTGQQQEVVFTVQEVALTVVSAYHDNLHLIRVAPGGGGGCSRAVSEPPPPLLSTLAMHLGSAGLTGTAPSGESNGVQLAPGEVGLGCSRFAHTGKTPCGAYVGTGNAISPFPLPAGISAQEPISPAVHMKQPPPLSLPAGISAPEPVHPAVHVRAVELMPSAAAGTPWGSPTCMAVVLHQVEGERGPGVVGHAGLGRAAV